jgi:hypothetical protein
MSKTDRRLPSLAGTQEVVLAADENGAFELGKQLRGDRAHENKNEDEQEHQYLICND